MQLNPDDVLTGEQQAAFMHAAALTIVIHNVSIDTLQRCLPIIGRLRDKGFDPEQILADASETD